MKKILLLFFVLITTFWFSQNTENEILYSIIINNFKKAKITAIEDVTSNGHIDEEDEEYKFDFVKKSLIGIEKETFDSFMEQNKESSKLQINFKTKKKIVWTTKNEMTEIFRKGKGWKEFYEKYGKTQGILSFSNIGFNKAKTQALFYYGNQSDWLAGSGHLVLFEKINGKWKLSISTMLWIS